MKRKNIISTSVIALLIAGFALLIVKSADAREEKSKQPVKRHLQLLGYNANKGRPPVFPPDVPRRCA